ncbi:hypothetical protein CEXT_689231 [Caerostris extrusa]|uniref:Uncharacterized protein n=1 Tax=Caerostris extrusa TaxID=172846 RepID=A0AAV4X4X4_CAEEX|nr:hypothetical protein CEXT_689231 [Caerostris extrusa]
MVKIQRCEPRILGKALEEGSFEINGCYFPFGYEIQMANGARVNSMVDHLTKSRNHMMLQIYALAKGRFFRYMELQLTQMGLNWRE